MKTNVLLLDTYKNIDKLVSYAFSFSNRLDRKLKIIYVFDFTWMSQAYMVGTSGHLEPGLVTAEAEARKEFDAAEIKIQAVVGEYMKHHAIKVPFEISVSQNNRVDLVKEEKEKDPSMLLLISNHQTYTEITGGLVSYPNIIEDTECPVFVIPEGFDTYVLDHAVYATDYNPEDVISLKHLSDFMKHSEGTHLTILHNEENYDFNEQLKWKGFKEIVKEEIKVGDIDFALKTKNDFLSGIEEYTENNNPDLLVFLKERRGFFKQIFTSSEVKNVLTHLNKPILIYHQKEK